MAKINSRDKGKRGELEIAHIMQGYGYDARRGQQFSGLQGDADVVGVPHLHLEIKRVEHLNLDKAMEQSIRDARDGEIPVVMHRKDRQPWRVTLSLEDFMMFFQAWEKEQSNESKLEAVSEDSTARDGNISRDSQ